MAAILLTACAPGRTQAPPDPPPCTPSAFDPNIYRATPQGWVNIIFQFASTPVAPNIAPQDSQIQQAQYAAFERLIFQARRWSSVDNIVLSPTREIRITVTLISPELIQSVYLNQALFRRAFFSNSNDLIKNTLNNLAARDELLFLVTVTASNYDEAAIGDSSVTLNIPLTEMTLVNASNLVVGQKHDDHSLNEEIHISQGAMSGYIAYPFAIQSGDECVWALDPKFNTSITLNVPNILVNGVDQGPQTWTIQQAPLVDVGMPPDIPSFIIPPGFDPARMSPVQTPPQPVFNKPKSDTVYWDDYWENMARYIWEKITLADVP